MSKPTRYRINAAICAVPVVHAIYWFASGNVKDATGFWIAFFVAEGVIGILAAIWFLSRSRSFTV
jgi:Na+-driven multidrug efflux pump